MSPRERLLSALRREPVDRVPIAEMAIDWRVMRGLGYRRYVQMVRELDLDGIAVNQALYLFGWRRFVLPHVSEYTDEWGVRSRFTGELLPVPVAHPAPTPDALEHFVPPRPERNPLLKAIRYIKRRAPERAIVLASRNDFAASWFLSGLDNLLISFIEQPEFAERLSRMVSDYFVRFFPLAIRAGVDIVFLTDDYAFKSGTLMAPDHFDRFIFPGLVRSVNAIHESGALCVKHTDGNISSILDRIVDSGVDAIGPLEPAAGNDLVAIRHRYEDRIAVVGNVDVDLLSRGTTDEVATATRDLVAALAPLGGHVLSSGNTISASVSPANFRTMVEASRAP